MRVRPLDPCRRYVAGARRARRRLPIRGRIPPVRSGLLLVAIVSTLGMPYQVLMPVMASDVLGGGAHTLGFLMTSAGLGALVGTLYLARGHTVVGLGRRIAQATIVFGLALIAFRGRAISGCRCWSSRYPAPAS